MHSHKFIIWYKGKSIDFRTNQWSVQCKKCKQGHAPKTTMFAEQLVTCESCGQEELINWNTFVDQLKK